MGLIDASRAPQTTHARWHQLRHFHRAIAQGKNMAGDVIEMSSVKAQLGQACMTAAAAELATMLAVKKMVDTIAADKASGNLSAPEEYLAYLFNPGEIA